MRTERVALQRGKSNAKPGRDGPGRPCLTRASPPPRSIAGFKHDCILAESASISEDPEQLSKADFKQLMHSELKLCVRRPQSPVRFSFRKIPPHLIQPSVRFVCIPSYRSGSVARSLSFLLRLIAPQFIIPQSHDQGMQSERSDKLGGGSVSVRPFITGMIAEGTAIVPHLNNCPAPEKIAAGRPGTPVLWQEPPVLLSGTGSPVGYPCSPVRYKSRRLECGQMQIPVRGLTPDSERREDSGSERREDSDRERREDSDSERRELERERERES